MKTFGSSTNQHQNQMCSVEDSRARTYRSPGEELVSKVNNLDFGRNLGESYAHYSPVSLSWKTFQRCLFEVWGRFSGRFTRAGMMLSGIVYQRKPLAPITGGIESLSSPGPNTEGMWPTPCADGDRTTMFKQGGMPLGVAVRMWPTPTVKGNYNKKGLSPKSGDGLATAVKKFPTPRSSPIMAARCRKPRGKYNLEEEVGPMKAGWALSPDWVELLMGFPKGYTDVGIQGGKTERLE